MSPTAPTGMAPYGVEMADMDGDGDLDVVTADLVDQEFSTVSVLKNNGNGTFAAPASYDVGPSAKDLRLADFNGDGRADVVVVLSLSGDSAWDTASYVTVLLNNGSGGLGGALNYYVGESSNPATVAVGDFDGDGHIDFAAGGITETRIYIYRNTGSGNFALWMLVPFSSASSLAVADFNGDGKLDLVAGDSDGAQVMLNNGAGFTPRPYISNSPDRVEGIATGDFDKDGKADFATAGRSLSVYHNSGAGLNFVKTAYAAGENQGGIKVADMDGDGNLDITISNYLGNSVSVYSNDGAGLFADRRDWGVGPAPSGHAIGDVNGDGKKDIVAAASSASTVNVVLNAGGRFYIARREYGLPGGANGIEFADFNRDGYMDAVSGASVSNQDGPVVFYGKTDGTFADGIQVENWGNNMPTDVAVGDFNGDGWPDFVTSIFSPGNAVRVTLNRGNGTFLPSVVYAAGGNPSGVAVGDLNGDGKLDIVNSNGSQLDNSVSVFINNGNGTFQPQVRVVVGFRPSDVLLADFDKDGRAEVLVTHYGTSSVYYFKPSASGVLGAPVIISVGNPQGNAVAGDFDNDGWLDAMLAAGNAKLLRNNQIGGFQAAINTPVPAAFIAAGDWDADGRMDIAGTDGVNDLATIGWNTGSSVFVTTGPMQAGFQPGRVGSADLDGNGLPELVTANLRARSLSVFTNVTTQPTHIAGIITLDGRAAAMSNVPLTFELRQTGTNNVIETHVIRLAADGSFTIGVSHTGTFDLVIKGGTFLRKTILNVNVVFGNTSTVAATLTNGDVNGDNSVGLGDFAALRASIGMSVGDIGFNPNADLNGDGAVTLGDFALLRSRFGQSGD